MIFILGFIALVAAVFCIAPWILMIILGALASVLGIASLALGFWACLLIVLLLSFIGSFFQ